MIVKALFSDFDGVFTDNHVLIDESGYEYVRCFRGDGIGIEKLKKSNVLFFIVSSEIIPLAEKRAKKLGVDCYTSVKNKYDLINLIQEKNGLNKSDCAFIGNDINDLPAFKAVGLKIAVKDSYPDILKSADMFLKKVIQALQEAYEYINN